MKKIVCVAIVLNRTVYGCARPEISEYTAVYVVIAIICAVNSVSSRQYLERVDPYFRILTIVQK